jgi:hypothetical protein
MNTGLLDDIGLELGATCLCYLARHRVGSILSDSPLECMAVVVRPSRPDQLTSVVPLSQKTNVIYILGIRQATTGTFYSVKICYTLRSRLKKATQPWRGNAVASGGEMISINLSHPARLSSKQQPAGLFTPGVPLREYDGALLSDLR